MQKSGVTAEFVYNADGLRVQKTVNGVATKYTLHGKNVVHMTSGTDELHVFYDAQNRPAVVVYNGTAYAYVKSLQGDVVAILDENGNAVVSYGYDAWGAPLCSAVLFAHVRVRFIAWKDPWSVIEGSGYQITQSLFAIAAGSWLGKGLTQGRPNDIPIVESDFIFSAITEEFGILFAICLILIYLGVFIHFLKIAMDVRGRFYKLLAYGFSICFIFQVFLTIGGVTKFIPSTGVTLPLISYGGSSVASTLIIFAVMQGIFIIAYKEDDENEEEQAGQPDESDRKKYD